MIRYGVGLSYEVFNNGYLRLSPVVEFVGWTALGGKESVVSPTGVQIQDAAGDTIVNGKLGLRLPSATTRTFTAATAGP